MNEPFGGINYQRICKRPIWQYCVVFHMRRFLPMAGHQDMHYWYPSLSPTGIGVS